MLFSAFNGSTVQHLLSDSAEAKYTNKCFKKIADNQFWKCRLLHYCTNNWSMKQHWTWVIQLSRTNDTYHVEFDAWPKLWITFQTPPRSRMYCWAHGYLFLCLPPSSTAAMVRFPFIQKSVNHSFFRLISGYSTSSLLICCVIIYIHVLYYILSPYIQTWYRHFA